MEKLLTGAELAETLALSTSTILDWFEAGRLPGFKLGRVVRFRESEVLDWLEAQRDLQRRRDWLGARIREVAEAADNFALAHVP